MRTVTLELLRHGPSHNQLLSPLTPYLALCGNHAAVTIHVPFEHNQFLHRLRALGERGLSEGAVFQMDDTARTLGGILALVPGLTAEMGHRGVLGEAIHLRLVISASELALLPFELALSPPGHVGAGQAMLLRSRGPVCLTRETSRRPEIDIAWPERPRILFVHAAPDGDAVPAAAHLLALRGALDPWLRASTGAAMRSATADYALPTGQPAGVEQHLTVLPAASLAAIREACAATAYTHVHFLAHGRTYAQGEDVRFGLHLHGERAGDPPEIVSGERLATALFASSTPPCSGYAKPPIVTLAACGGAAHGTVAGAGASIAHALSSRGIPFVAAGQFPLSFEGSVRMVETLYGGLLWGLDPRLVLDDLRRRLFTELPRTNDWASLTAYASLPEDFEELLKEIQVGRASDALDVALDFVDDAIRALTGGRIDPHRIEAGRTRIERAAGRLRALLDADAVEHRRSRISGLLASAGKREAQLLFGGAVADPSARRRVLGKLRSSQKLYWTSFEADRSQSWAIVQHLSLSHLLAVADGVGASPGSPGAEPKELWRLADILSRIDLEARDDTRRRWALANLVELEVMADLLDCRPAGRPEGELEAVKLCTELVRLAGDTGGFAVYATLRQMQRYLGWYRELVPTLLTEGAEATVRAAVDVLRPAAARQQA